MLCVKDIIQYYFRLIKYGGYANDFVSHYMLDFAKIKKLKKNHSHKI